jgi:uncharacterized protein (TIGR03086 family)
MEVAELHRRTVAEFLDRVGAITDEQWHDITPCTQWDVRALVNHVVAEDRWTGPLLGGSTMADIGDRFDGDILGDDPITTARHAATEATDAVAAKHRTAKVHLSYGDEEPDEYLMQLSADHLIHAWDLAVAIDGDTELAADLVGAIADWFVDRQEAYSDAGIVAEPVLIDDQGDPAARLLAATGRDPAWRPGL